MATVIAIVGDAVTGVIDRQLYCDESEVAAQAGDGEVAISSPEPINIKHFTIDVEAVPMVLAPVPVSSASIAEEEIDLESDRTYSLACATGTTAKIGDTTYTSVDNLLTVTFPAGDAHVVTFTDPGKASRRIVVKTRSFDALKDHLAATVNEQRSELLQTPITLAGSGYVLDGDDQAQLSILAVTLHSVALLASGNLIPDVDWVLADNSVVTLDDTAQLDMLAQVAARRKAVITSARSRKDDILAATTVAGAYAAFNG